MTTLCRNLEQTGYSVGVTVRLESALSALDLIMKMERMKERRSSNHATKDHPEEITKNLDGRFCINSYFIKFVGQNPIKVTGKMIKDALEADLLSLKSI